MDNLKQIREKRNLNQVKVAMDLQLSQESISNYERDYSKPSFEILIKLADYFDTSTDYLLGRTDDDRPINFDKDRLSNEEISILLNYRRLPANDKTKIVGYMDALIKD